MFENIKLRFTTEQWPINQLVQLYEAERINLSPHYQRNSIWSLSNQRSLIATVTLGNPLPTFFVRTMPRNKFEMVDGQQRSRSIIGYWNGEFADNKHVTLSSAIKADPRNARAFDSFLAYKLSITLLDQSFTDKEIEDFYVLVNSSGMRLNRPELFKAEYYSTRFLKLATELAGASAFEALSLFSDKSADRMNDIDFVSELMALLSFGFTDKKEKVDVLYASDISEAQYRDLKQRFEAALARIAKLDAIVPVNRTRFKQKGDFYTLFGFIANNPNLALKALEHIYNILLRLSPHIRPSQENCDPLLEYAVNCVTQSNSKKARESRNKLFDELFLNSSDQPNATQDAVAEYFALKSSDYEKVSSYLVFRLEALDRSIPD
jgi:hypothetical protein